MALNRPDPAKNILPTSLRLNLNSKTSSRCSRLGKMICWLFLIGRRGGNGQTGITC